ncbi:hypothetical protein ANO11243_043570 [Dothideomycetidae sp. 11243]|nr:hypothetical protein ANO11243_043570 [fungal sp. No.11243]
MADAEKAAGMAQAHEPNSSSGSEQEKSAQSQQQHDDTKQQNSPDKKKGSDDKKDSGGKDGKKEEEDKPAGGFDDTPIPKAPPGYTVKFTFIRATNLPMADINTLSSDPYVAAELSTSLPQRHKEDPPLRFRTQTIRRNTDPTWNSEWIVANVPSSGFKLKARLYDEDPADHDDRLGNAHIHVSRIDENWPGIKEQAYSIKKRMGSKRAYLVRAVATCIRATKHMNGDLLISVEVLGRTKDENGGRAYTVGPSWWVKHYSPMLGRITGMKEDHDGEDPKQGGPVEASEKINGSGGQEMSKQDSAASQDGKKRRKSTQRYNFQANQMQLPGPVPAELYHRYVEFKPFVQGMFTHSGLRGFLLNKALHHQHARVYNYDRSTLWGFIPPNDPEALTKRFLELVHYDKGGKIFTYVLTLDALMRFTETGKEFGIDMLSKHTMHSDVEIYIAFSGEFFIRRHRGKKRRGSTKTSKQDAAPTSAGHGEGPDPHKAVVGDEAEDTEKDGDKSANDGGEVNTTTPVAAETKEIDEESLDPDNYELIIDNDSGTYRPAPHLLPILRLFLQRSFPGLHVRVLECQKDKEIMDKLKQEQRDRKKAEAGGEMVFAQRDHSDSLSSQSSSDDEEFDAIQGGQERHFRHQLARDAQWRAGGRIRHFKGLNPRHERKEGTGGQVEDKGQQIGQGQGQGQGQEQAQERQADEDGGQHKDTSHGPSETTAAEHMAQEQDQNPDPEGGQGSQLHNMGQGQPIGRRDPEDGIETSKA